MDGVVFSLKGSAAAQKILQKCVPSAVQLHLPVLPSEDARRAQKEPRTSTGPSSFPLLSLVILWLLLEGVKLP